MIKSFLNNIKIYDVGFDKIRLGNKFDGGYVVLKELIDNTDELYSFGIDNDISFERDLFKRNPNCTFFLFDHTIDSIPIDNKNFIFKKQGVSHVKSNEHVLLEDCISDKNELSKKTLKMDVEWCEWDIFENVDIETLTHFDQIICEFHVIPVVYNLSNSPYFTKFSKNVYNKINSEIFSKYRNVMDKLTSYFTIFHVHINNSLPLAYIDGHKTPQLLELSFVKNDVIKDKKVSDVIYPIQNLDYPNKTDRPDILNFKWNE